MSLALLFPDNIFRASTLCLKKNDTAVAHYNFNAHQPILVIFGTELLRQHAIKW